MGVLNFQKLNNVPAGQCKLSLVCFHWAGGAGIAYKPLAKVLEASNISVHSITLPGRNGRGTATMFRNMTDILQVMLPEFASYHAEHDLGDQPLVFFGHSFGGLLAYELYKAVSANDEPRILIEKIIVSAVRCPADLTAVNKDPNRVYFHKMTNEDLTEYMRDIGGKACCDLHRENVGQFLVVHFRTLQLPLSGYFQLTHASLLQASRPASTLPSSS
jgi:surfactin synthase thioesterase subunit